MYRVISLTTLNQASDLALSGYDLTVQMHVRDERSVYWKDQSRALLRGYSGVDPTHICCFTYDRITVVRILSWVPCKLRLLISHKCGRCLTRGDMGQREQGEEMSLTKFYTRKTAVESMKTELIAEPCCQGIFVPVTKIF